MLFHSINASSILARGITHISFAKLAQLVELLFCKQKVVGSTPTFGFGGCSLSGKASVCDTGDCGFKPRHSPFCFLKMSSHKYIKNSLDFDTLYRARPKNALNLPVVKKSSFFVSDISSLPKTLSNANAVKILSASTSPRILVASKPVNAFSIRKGDPVGCALILSKKQALDFISSCSLAFSTMTPPPVFSVGLNQPVASLFFSNLQGFFPFAHYESSLLVAQRINLKVSFSIHFSNSLDLGSICLFSANFPFFGLKKNLNNFRTILREIEQSG